MDFLEQLLARLPETPAPVRGLWIGPYFADVQGAGQLEIGRVSLWMGLAMVAGNFAYGPLDRLLQQVRHDR